MEVMVMVKASEASEAGKMPLHLASFALPELVGIGGE